MREVIGLEKFDIAVTYLSIIQKDWTEVIDHMIDKLDEKGRMAIIAPHGILFKGLRYERMREKLIQDNLLDTVIGLPSNLIPGISTNICLMVFKKARDHKDVLFIDVSSGIYYEKDKAWTILADAGIASIVEVYKGRVVIEENNYNLNIPMYTSKRGEEEVNLEKLERKIKNIEDRLKGVER